MEHNELYWQALQQRDPAFDGTFVYAVQTTGIYCRPVCPSRRPQRTHVVFFAGPAQAEAAGYRACQRCQPDQSAPQHPHLDRIAQICRYLEEPHEGVPTLDALAARFALSPSYLQRVFKRIVGVSPRQYADAHRRARLTTRLRDGTDVSNALYDAGYTSSSGFYSQATSALGMTPTTYRAGGLTMHILYAVVECPLGQLLVAATEQGICRITLGDHASEMVAELAQEFPAATLSAGDPVLQQWVHALLDYLHGEQPHLDLPLDIQATAFQRKVWEELRNIPYGSTCSYQQVAERIGQPGASRAVARACATNPVALVIPCHRVVHADGTPGGYRWGSARKQQLLAQEAAQPEPAAAA